MMDDKLKPTEAERSKREAQRMKHKGCRVICVCFGVQPEIKQLKSMATDEEVVLYFGSIKEEDVRQKVIRGMCMTEKKKPFENLLK